MSILDQMRVLLREHKEEAEARKAAIKPDPPHVTVPESLCRSTELASWMAYFTLVYFLLLYTFDIARDRAGSLHVTHFGTWVGEVQIYAPYIIGFMVVAVGIPYVAKIAIPTFTRLSWSEAPTEKAWSLFLAIAVSLVVIAGTFTVQGDTILERDREGVVAVDQAAQANAVLASRIDDAQHRLDEMTRSASQYVRTAASMSPAAYDAFVAERVDDPQYIRLRSYRATAVEADNLRNSMSELRAQQASQTVASQVADRVTTQSNGWIAATLGWLEGARAMLLSFVMDIVCLIMPLISLRLRLKRNQQLGMGDSSGWADDAHRIEDHTADDPLPVQPMKGPREVVRDAETGEELIKIVTKPHWRKKKGKPQRIEADVMAMADETGVPDGGARAGSTGAMQEPVNGAPEPDERHAAADDENQDASEGKYVERAVAEGEGHGGDADEQQGRENEAYESAQEPILQLTDEDYANLPSAADPLADKSEAEIEELYPELATEATIPLGSDGADGVMQRDEDTEEPPVRAARGLIAAE